jgi:ornithine decarboxylase
MNSYATASIARATCGTPVPAQTLSGLPNSESQHQLPAGRFTNPKRTDGSETPTPFLLIDLDVIDRQYRRLAAALPQATIHYAVKANPSAEILRTLSSLGSNFDVASPGEIDLCLELGVDPRRISYGNTVKKERDITYAAGRGISVYTVDCESELDKIIRAAPGSTVYVRITTSGTGADWPLSRKFGCAPAEAFRLMVRADRAGLRVGVSFHVGSQQRNHHAWDQPIAEAAELFGRLTSAGVTPVAINLGGGFPGSYLDPAADINLYGLRIAAALVDSFGATPPPIVTVEPGRYLVADAGVIECEVVLISQRDCCPGRRWVYLDAGLFNGLIEALGEAIKYRISCSADGSDRGPVVLAGPTCDSADVLYERFEYPLPISLRIGDRIRIHSAAAYTASYSSVGFNGFEPMKTYFTRSTTCADDGR